MTQLDRPPCTGVQWVVGASFAGWSGRGAGLFPSSLVVRLMLGPDVGALAAVAVPAKDAMSAQTAAIPARRRKNIDLFPFRVCMIRNVACSARVRTRNGTYVHSPWMGWKNLSEAQMDWCLAQILPKN
ncbi:hypothetical protein ACFV6F_23865 [Kitasatospora phosalacinea]|uniref:hypothetical protein n=1 Tax=Kitasatospora phosalacinea TaxID=2065 RepID=UPI0036495DD9